jgi:Protein of unknown function (DUF3175)
MTGRRWSQAVTKSSDALDLEARVFTLPPKRMALSLKRSAELRALFGRPRAG